MGLRRLGLALAALLLATPVAAADARLEGDERAQALARLQESQQSLTTLRATVVQRKRHPLLKAEAVRRGTLLLERPDRLRWEVRGPDPMTLVADGPSLLLYRPDRREAERRDLRDDLAGRAAMGFLVGTMRFDLAEMEKRFEVAVHRDPVGLRLTLTPRSRWLAQALAAVEISQREGDPIPRRFVMTGPRGERTETVLDDLEVNPRLPQDAFTLRLGPEVRVVDVRRAPDAAGDQR
jgi:outer membrane lipoprotein-sorting protein